MARKKRSDPKPPTGFIETANPDTGAAEVMAFWLPRGVSAKSLGLVRVIINEEKAA